MEEIEKRDRVLQDKLDEVLAERKEQMLQLVMDKVHCVRSSGKLKCRERLQMLQWISNVSYL